MLTPAFELTQDENYLVVAIQAPYAKESECELYFEDYKFLFFSHPYHLRLNLPGKVLPYTEQSSGPFINYDFEKETFIIKVPKHTKGEEFEGLDSTTLLLAPKKNKNEASDDVSEDDEEMDWSIEQVRSQDKFGVSKIKGHECGFAQSYSFPFFNTENKLDIFDVENAKNKPPATRSEERLEEERKHFDVEHYIADLYEEKAIKNLINYTTEWDVIYDEIQKANPPISPDDKTAAGKKRYPISAEARLQPAIIDVRDRPLPGLDYIQEIISEMDVNYYCELCDAPCGPSSIMPHLIGYKHQLRCLKRINPDCYERNKDQVKKRFEGELIARLLAHEKKYGRGKIKVFEEIDDPHTRPAYDCPGPSWRNTSSIPDIKREKKDAGDTVVHFTSDESKRLKKWPSKDYNLDEEHTNTTFLGLVDILYAFAYNKRTTEGENTDESGWTINKLSATLCWFEVYSKLSQVTTTCIRRSLCFPLYRSFELSLRVLEDLRKIMLLGKNTVLKCLLEISEIFSLSEDRHILNRLFINDYISWMQTKVFQSQLIVLAEALKKAVPTKGDISLNLENIESYAEEWRTQQ